MTGPEAAEAFYRAPDEQLSVNVAYKMMVPVFGKDVAYDNPPARMGEQLGMIRPALQDRRMRTYGEIVSEEVRRAVAGWGEEGEFDLVEFCASLTNFTSTHCLIGREFREEMSEEFAKVHDDFLLIGEDNLRRYLPVSELRIRVHPLDTAFELFARVCAARAVGS